MTQFNIEAEKIIDWQVTLLIGQAILQDVSESRKINITQEMLDDARKEALAKLNNLMIKERIEELRQFSDNYGYTDWISDRIAELNSQLIGDKNE